MQDKSFGDFALFLETWNMLQGFTTPKVHTRIVDWLQQQWDEGETKMLLMAFRSCGKSTLVGLFCAWLLWRDPNLRILVLSAESNLAGKMARNIKRIIETHPFTKMLKPRHADQWASDRFTVLRDIESRDPSVLSAGVAGNITGTRADLIIYDDVEVPNTCDSHEKREHLRERLNESAFILSSGGRQLYIGTPHNYFSIYAKNPRQEIDEKKSFLEGFKRLEVPLINSLGKSVWPERYSLEDIEQMRRDRGPQKFASQMMLEPKNISESRLDTALLEFYDAPLKDHLAHDELQLKIGDQKIVSCTAWWDPSFASARGDSSVLAILYGDTQGRKYIHHLEYIKIDPKKTQDEAKAQCKIVTKLMKKYFVPAIAVEANGIGGFLPSILRNTLSEWCVKTAILEKHSSQNKNDRIIQAYDAIMAARHLYIHESVKKTPYLTEMMEWNPNTKRNNDDGLDAVAGALSLEPERIKRIYFGGPNLTFSSQYKQQQSNNDFDL
ncbi:MAG: phage terminase large subunit [Pseudomonadota bacterium]